MRHWSDMHTSACFKIVNKCKISKFARFTFKDFSSIFKYFQALICFKALSRALKFLFQIQAFSRIYIQGLFKYFQVLSSTLSVLKHFQGPWSFYSKFKHFQGFLKHTMNPVLLRHRLCPWSGAAPGESLWVNALLASPRPSQSRVNTTTTKPEVCNSPQHCQRSTEPHPLITGNLVKSEHGVSEKWKWTER